MEVQLFSHLTIILLDLNKLGLISLGVENGLKIYEDNVSNEIFY